MLATVSTAFEFEISGFGEIVDAERRLRDFDMCVSSRSGFMFDIPTVVGASAFPLEEFCVRRRRGRPRLNLGGPPVKHGQRKLVVDQRVLGLHASAPSRQERALPLALGRRPACVFAPCSLRPKF